MSVSNEHPPARPPKGRNDLHRLFEKITEQVGQVIFGKEEQVQLSLCCLFAQGHLLIEDIPGIGKTTLAKVLAETLGLDFRRVQCTSDMLPGDILGVSVFEQKTGRFIFHPGPIFTQVLLSDEINRTTPKTQSALLEAMEEGQVTIEGKTRPLPAPFFVIATLNPLEQVGTFSLPESQLDRFLFRIRLGYPDRASELRLLRAGGSRKKRETIRPLLSPEKVIQCQQLVAKVHLSDPLIEYIQNILDHSRTAPDFHTGLSPRAGLSLARASQAWAFIKGRDYCLPEDVQKLLPFIASHRLHRVDSQAEMNSDELMALLLTVPVPT
ncbi:MAG: MoxR family ATPase [Proteobacteria bacterium]|nr:MoxR family ATPase [Pseudomonadota bacterium]MBU1060796.1 MoxR family ATPase [Pseudomonadota bacterium]